MNTSKLKSIRVSKGLTQEELAIKVGVTRQTISLIEINNYNPSLNLCKKIALTLDVTLNDLFWEGIIHEK